MPKGQRFSEFWTRNVRSSALSNRIGGKDGWGRKNPQQQLAPCRGHQCGRVKRMGHCVGILRRKRKGQTQPKTYGEVGKRGKVEGGEKRVFRGTCIRCRMICLSSNRRELFMVGVGSPPHTHASSTLYPHSQPYPTLTSFRTSPTHYSFQPFFLSPQITPCNTHPLQRFSESSGSSGATETSRKTYGRISFVSFSSGLKGLLELYMMYTGCTYPV